MKKVLIAMVMVSLVVLTYGMADALQGPCSDCHAMHASQNGTATGWTDNPAGNSALTRFACVACHTAAGGEGTNSTTGAPAVQHTSDPGGQGPGATNAGGTFYYLGTSDANAHNVWEVQPGQDSIIGPNIGLTPPGWDPLATSGFAGGQVAGGDTSWSSQLTCGGFVGCHGEHNVGDDSFGAISGAHHANTNGTVAGGLTAATGRSYRFLRAIRGYEAADYEWSATDAAGSHNEYYAINGNDGYADKTTINYLCAECHGVFHDDIEGPDPGNAPWRRHPTDIDLPTVGGEYSAYNPNGGGGPTTRVYSVEAPVGSTTYATRAVVDPTGVTNDIVLCVSCHRAHGTDQADLLRWDYASMVAGSVDNNTGCFVCHTTKDTGL